MRWECRERFPATDFKGNHKLAIPTCITARASRTCRDACRDRQPAMAGENIPGIPGTCATRNFTYLARGPWWKAQVYDNVFHVNTLHQASSLMHQIVYD